MVALLRRSRTGRKNSASVFHRILPSSAADSEKKQTRRSLVSPRSSWQKKSSAILVLLSMLASFRYVKDASRYLEAYTSTKNVKKLSHLPSVTSLAELEGITSKILGPDDFGNSCPPGCGCKDYPVDCPQHYSIEDVIKSADAVLDVSSSLYCASQLELQHADAMKKCQNNNNLKTGGWCLSHRGIGQTLTLPDKRIINVPEGHVLPSDPIVETLEELFRAEGVISVSDFGAGVGQYGVSLKSKMPGLIYHAYDGAGDIESYTNGFVKYSDFTQPLDLPVTEWVLSLEVGEHIPSKYEGIFIRNLHRHNCKGIILSWGVLGQGGENHINLHSNTYITNIFLGLGYLRDFELEAKLRNPEGNHDWFVKSAMAFRRRHANCGRPVLRRISPVAIAQNNSSIDQKETPIYEEVGDDGGVDEEEQQQQQQPEEDEEKKDNQEEEEEEGGGGGGGGLGKDDDASSVPSVRSESDKKDTGGSSSSMKTDAIADGNDNDAEQKEGSAVAAMGVASTVVRQLSTPNKNDEYYQLNV